MKEGGRGGGERGGGGGTGSRVGDARVRAALSGRHLRVGVDTRHVRSRRRLRDDLELRLHQRRRRRHPVAGNNEIKFDR